MTDRLSTPERILESARKLFNQKGYGATTLAEIAADVGIAQGNLTYHFPNKSELALRLEAQAQGEMKVRWERKREGQITDDYIEHLLFAKRLTWSYRFLLRDHPLFSEDPDWLKNNPYMLSDFQELRHLMERLRLSELWCEASGVDVEVLARALWINSRYWMDHLRELENREQLTWDDLERGIDHHLDVLGCFLTPSARDAFAAAKVTALRYVNQFDEPT
ncbi:MAG: TetR family transcriptional regulator [Pseudomonadota bacterium]